MYQRHQNPFTCQFFSMLIFILQALKSSGSGSG